MFFRYPSSSGAESKSKVSVNNVLVKPKHQINHNFAINIDSSPSNQIPFLVQKVKGVQGNEFCLYGTRVPISYMVRSVKKGSSLEEIATTLQKHYKVNFTTQELKSAIEEFETFSGR